MKNNQNGLTLIGLLFVSAVLIGVAVVGMKVIPTVIEYYTIMKHIKSVASGGATTVSEVRKSYDLKSSIEATPSISGADLGVAKQGNQVVISFEYAKKIPIAGNVSLLIDYSGSSSGGKPMVE